MNARATPVDIDAAQAWLPEGKRAAVCFTIDDVHPGKSSDAYDAGGDLGAGAMGHVEWLLDRHPALRVTLFVTPDWREISPFPTRSLLARIPGVRDRAWLAPRWPEGTMRLDRHPDFVEYLRGLPRVDAALHGLHHVHRGPRIPVEFQEQDRDECRRMLERGIGIFRSAGLPLSPGMTPPAFNAPPPLLDAMADAGLLWVASARDLATPVAPDACAAMSGLHGVPLFQPARVASGRLVHLPTNFQATSLPERAFSVVEQGGLLSIKAHIIKNCAGHLALDGMDALYRNYLDLLFTELARRYGDAIWWASMNEVAHAYARAVRAVEGSTCAPRGLE